MPMHVCRMISVNIIIIIIIQLQRQRRVGLAPSRHHSQENEIVYRRRAGSEIV